MGAAACCGKSITPVTPTKIQSLRPQGFSPAPVMDPTAEPTEPPTENTEGAAATQANPKPLSRKGSTNKICKKGSLSKCASFSSDLSCMDDRTKTSLSIRTSSLLRRGSTSSTPRQRNERARPRSRRRSMSDGEDEREVSPPRRDCSTPKELCLPETEDTFIQLGQSALQLAMDSDANPEEWSSVRSPKGLNECTAEVIERDGVVHTRVVCTFDATLEEIRNVIVVGDGGPKGSKTIIFQHPSAPIKLMWIGIKVPIVTDREFVCCQWSPALSSTGATAKVIRVSLPEDITYTLREESKKHVRGFIHTQTTWLTRDPAQLNRTIFKQITACEPGGFVPTVKRITGNKAAEAVLALQKFVLSEREKSGYGSGPVGYGAARQ